MGIASDYRLFWRNFQIHYLTKPAIWRIWWTVQVYSLRVTLTKAAFVVARIHAR